LVETASYLPVKIKDSPLIFVAQRGAHLHQKLMMTSQKRRFIPKIAKAKNARAFGVRWSAWLGGLCSEYSMVEAFFCRCVSSYH